MLTYLANVVLDALYEKVRNRSTEDWHKQFNPWYEKVVAWKKDKPINYKHESQKIQPQAVIQTISKITAGEAIIVTDVGQHQMWTALFFDFKNPRSLLTSGGLGTMGYGVPAALGAQVGKPEKTVACISGDGGFMMNCQELMTIADLNLPVKIIILNNQYLGMVAQWQRFFYNKNYAHSSLKTKADFVKISEAMGVPAFRLERTEEMYEKLEKAFKTEGPVLVEICIPEDEDVLPMVPPGSRLDQMMMGGSQK